MYEDLVKKNLLQRSFAEELKEQFPGITSDIIVNHFSNKDKKPRGYRHSDEAKKFALTLHFYSSRAYEFHSF